MTVYIKDFQFVNRFGKKKILFKYFTGYDWKVLVLDKKFENVNITVYTRYVLDSIINDICGEERDPIRRNTKLKTFDSNVSCVVQLNGKMFADATKIFS